MKNALQWEKQKDHLIQVNPGESEWSCGPECSGRGGARMEDTLQRMGQLTGLPDEMLFEPLPCVQASMCVFCQFSPSKGSCKGIYIKIGGG